MQYDDHLPVTRLEDGVLDVVIENVHFVASDRREAETWRRDVEWLGELLICASVDSGVFSPTIGMCL